MPLLVQLGWGVRITEHYLPGYHRVASAYFLLRIKGERDQTVWEAQQLVVTTALDPWEVREQFYLSLVMWHCSVGNLC